MQIFHSLIDQSCENELQEHTTPVNLISNFKLGIIFEDWKYCH